MESETLRVRVEVNGRPVERDVEPRMLLADFLRHTLRLTGTHVGCSHGVCGACMVLLDQQPVRSCTVFAIQVDGAKVTTVEGLAVDGEPLPALHQAFNRCHALQCGFCTSGMLISATHLLAENPDPDPQSVRVGLAGNLCRCTGYMNIVRAVIEAARVMRERS